MNKVIIADGDHADVMANRILDIIVGNVKSKHMPYNTAMAISEDLRGYLRAVAREQELAPTTELPHTTPAVECVYVEPEKRDDYIYKAMHSNAIKHGPVVRLDADTVAGRRVAVVDFRKSPPDVYYEYPDDTMADKMPDDAEKAFPGDAVKAFYENHKRYAYDILVEIDKVTERGGNRDAKAAVVANYLSSRIKPAFDPKT